MPFAAMPGEVVVPELLFETRPVGLSGLFLPAQLGRIDYRFSPEIRAEFGHAQDIGEARANSVTGKRGRCFRST